jgi:hypothetical protein
MNEKFRVWQVQTHVTAGIDKAREARTDRQFLAAFNKK